MIASRSLDEERATRRTRSVIYDEVCRAGRARSNRTLPAHDGNRTAMDVLTS